MKLANKKVFARRNLQPLGLFLCPLGGLKVNRFDAKKAMKDFVLEQLMALQIHTHLSI